jgi:hypothetical protein
MQISCAQMLLQDAAGHRPPPEVLKFQTAEELSVALAVLANCDWTHVTEDIVEGFAAANGVDFEELDDKIASKGLMEVLR